MVLSDEIIYYLLRNAFTGEPECIRASKHIMLTGRAEEITKAEYETYRDLHGIPRMGAYGDEY